jgi:hypothetical protein
VSTGDEIDRLYGLPLDEFTAARNELARRLKREGDEEAAADVSALRKPSVAAWVVNQLARERRGELRALLGAAADVKAGSPDAAERFRSAVDELALAGREVLVRAGRQPSDSVLQQVATTLRVAAAEDPDALAVGRLTRELRASGFAAALAGSAPPKRAGARTPPRRPPRDRARLEEARRAVAEARAQAAQLRRDALEADRAARQARAALESAERRLDEAEQRLAAARRS